MKKADYFDVLVIGGGAAGLMAAWQLGLAGKSVAVIEACNRLGGRIFTVNSGEHTIELGAEFIHGNLPLTLGLLQQAKAEIVRVEGSIWQHKDGRLHRQQNFIEDFDRLEKAFHTLSGDKSVAAFLTENLAGSENEMLRVSIRNYVEGYYAADLARASTHALYQELSKADSEQYRVKGGYHVLIQFLEKECRQSGVSIFLSRQVHQLIWARGEVTAITGSGSFSSKQALLTVPVGVLQTGAIRFSPHLPHISKIAQQLGFGDVVRIVFACREAFWRDAKFTSGRVAEDLGFLFSGQSIPTWWTRYPVPDRLFTGWLGGPPAQRMLGRPPAEVRTLAIASLSNIFGIEKVFLDQQLGQMWFHNWSADPCFCGAYSYEVVGGVELIRQMQQPVNNTLYFCGEGLYAGAEIGTVEAALHSAKEAADRLLSNFS